MKIIALLLLVAGLSWAQSPALDTKDQLEIRELQVRVLELKQQFDSIAKDLQDAQKRLQERLTSLAKERSCSRIGLDAANKLVCIKDPPETPNVKP